MGGIPDHITNNWWPTTLSLLEAYAAAWSPSNWTHLACLPLSWRDLHGPSLTEGALDLGRESWWWAFIPVPIPCEEPWAWVRAGKDMQVDSIAAVGGNGCGGGGGKPRSSYVKWARSVWGISQRIALLPFP